MHNLRDGKHMMEKPLKWIHRTHSVPENYWKSTAALGLCRSLLWFIELVRPLVSSVEELPKGDGLRASLLSTFGERQVLPLVYRQELWVCPAKSSTLHFLRCTREGLAG